MVCCPVLCCLPANRFLGIQLVIVLNQNYALQQQQQAAANGQAAAELRSYSGSGSATPLRKQPSGPMSPRQVCRSTYLEQQGNLGLVTVVLMLHVLPQPQQQQQQQQHEEPAAASGPDGARV
jgi:hypothetical protein